MEAMLNNNIEWIFFDVGSTLVDESKAYQHRINDAIAGTSITYDQFYDTMINYYKQNKKGYLETVKQYGLNKTAWHNEDEILYPAAKNCLRLLNEKYKIGIIANQSFNTEKRLRTFGIWKYIDLVAASAEEGVSKPDLGIFKIALDRAKCRAENAAMVGDRLDNDIVPANSLGMQTIWIKQGFCKFATPITELEIPNYTVDNLNDVCNIFAM